jgi:hypothetical protein
MDPRLLVERDTPCAERNARVGLDNVHLKRFCLSESLGGNI